MKKDEQKGPINCRVSMSTTIFQNYYAHLSLKESLKGRNVQGKKKHVNVGKEMNAFYLLLFLCFFFFFFSFCVHIERRLVRN